MASKAKHGKNSAPCGDEIVTRLCSINSSGLVFLTTRRFEVSSEVSLMVQTCTPGVSREWEVQGLVVDCRVARCREGLRYKITLLLHSLPEGLQAILREEQQGSSASYPPLRQAPLFGMN